MKASNPQSPSRSGRTRAGSLWVRATVLIALAATACESPVAPAACGPLPQVTVNVGETSSVAACFNDENGDVLSYTAASSNPGVATASISGTSITVTGISPGNTTVTVTASDPDGLQGQQSFAVMVPNRGPQPRGTVPNVTVQVGRTATVEASQYFSEPDGESLTYAASASDGGVASVSVAGSTITATAEAKGSTTLTITARDPGGLTATQSFRFTVPNRPPVPVGGIGAQTIEVGQSVTVDVAALFSDPDNDPLTYTAASSIPAVARTSVSGSAITITAAGPGATTITITARDDERATATQQVSVTVPQPNRAPQRVGSIPARTIDVGERATVNASQYFTDPDNDALSYAAASSSSSVARVSVSGSTVTITGAGAGSATITVTARDPEGLTATQQARVTVSQANRAPRPVGAIPPQTIGVGGRATVNASQYFSDPDNDALTYSATTSNSSVARASVSGSTVTITGAGAGSATITVTARDPEGLTATQQARVTVSQGNRPPRPVGTIPSQTINAGGTTTVNASQYFSDPDNDALTYSATSSNSGVARASVSGSTVTITGVSAGSATITVTARDPGSLSATQQFSVSVGSAGAPDLEFTNVTPTSVTGSPGDTVWAEFTLRNSGNATAAATTIRTYQSTNSSISTSDSEIGRLQTSSLAAGRTVTFDQGIILSSSASGTFYFGLCADAVAGESDTGNNCSRGVRVTVGGSSSGPDLVVSLSTASVTVSPGGSFSYDVTIRNQGDATSAATRARTFASTDATISTNDTQIGSASSVPSLGPSQEASGTQTLTVGADATPGTVYIGECVDAVSGESNTNNNCSSAITLTIQTGGGGGSDTTYTTGQTIETLPTGFWTPDASGGGIGFQFSAGSVTIRFNGTSSYIVENNIRYSCLSSSGCEIANRRVTRGSIRARSQSSGSLIAEPQWDGLLKATGTEGTVIRVRPGEDLPAALREVEAVLWIRPGGGEE